VEVVIRQRVTKSDYTQGKPYFLSGPTTTSMSSISDTCDFRGGIPGVFVSYDISPMKVINRESRPKTLSGFLTGICAIIGGTLTVAAAVDRGVYEGSRRIGKVHLR